MTTDQFRVYLDNELGGWMYDYVECPQAEPRGPYEDLHDATQAAQFDPGPSPSDYLL